MTREEAKQNLVALGIEEPTDAQVTNYLNQFHAPANRNEPTPQPNNNSDEEIDQLREKVKTLERESARKDIRAHASELGIVGEKADSVLSVFSDDVEQAKIALDSLSEIIEERETNAANKKEKEIADGSNNPGGGSPNNKDKRTEAEKIAEAIGERFAETNKASDAVLNSYF